MNSSLVTRFQNSALMHYAKRGWYWTNRIGKVNILTVVVIWHIMGQSYVAGAQKKTMYRHNWIQNVKPSRSIFEERW